MLLQFPVACIYLAIPLETECNKATLTGSSDVWIRTRTGKQRFRREERESHVADLTTAWERQMTTGVRGIV